MDSSVSPTHCAQEMSVWLFVFNQFGDLDALRPASVHSADGTPRYRPDAMRVFLLRRVCEVCHTGNQLYNVLI
jgi:hypothetical protein